MMAAGLLPDETHIGYAHLQVANLDRALTFYVDLLGFQLANRHNGRAFLSPDGQFPHRLLLTERPGARPKPPRTTGLYHVAIRLPDRVALARVFRRLMQHGYGLQGASDHLVSEALYLADPDGNGLELYRDRPRAEWAWDGAQVAMSSEPLDLRDLLIEAERDSSAWSGIHAGTDIGHVHLHVSDLKKAETFYADILGFTVMQRSYPGALFVAAGGYHHHIGLNVWMGRGAPPPPEDAVGLIAFAVKLPDKNAWLAAMQRVEEAGLALEERDDTVLRAFLRDFDSNGVALLGA